MWWCCGKTGRDAHGCKYSKHECKDDEDDLEDAKEREDEKLQKIRCMCCKGIGHKMTECPKDPNMRT